MNYILNNHVDCLGILGIIFIALGLFILLGIAWVLIYLGFVSLILAFLLGSLGVEKNVSNN